MSVGFSFRRSLRQIIFDGQKSDIDSRIVDKSEILQMTKYSLIKLLVK